MSVPSPSKDSCPSNLFIGLFWAAVIEGVVAGIGWLVWKYYF